MYGALYVYLTWTYVLDNVQKHHDLLAISIKTLHIIVTCYYFSGAT